MSAAVFPLTENVPDTFKSAVVISSVATSFFERSVALVTSRIPVALPRGILF